jgi:galactose mutarotase-like enzyme
MTSTSITSLDHRGWEIVRLEDELLQLDIVPEKGADILAIRWLPLGLNLLWRSPWGLRPKASIAPTGDSMLRFLTQYPGGWQTIFPNGGDACKENGVELGFHGEASLLPWDWVSETGELICRTELQVLPFKLEKRVSVVGPSVRVTETVENIGSAPQEVMWSHHPAFGAPFISSGTTVEAGAKSFTVDDARDTPAGDLEPGAKSKWPQGLTRSGLPVDLRMLPDQATPMDRFGYLSGFDEGRASITNRELPLRVDLTWDERIFPHAWYWLEAHATRTYPWFGEAYVFAIEPASSFPGQGLTAVKQKTGLQMTFKPGETKTVTVELTISEPK